MITTTSMLILKIGSLIFLFIISFLCASSPLIVGSDTPKKRRLLSYGNSIAAGVFLSAGLLHLLRSGEVILDAYFKYPVALLICCCTFLLILFLERVVFGEEFIKIYLIPQLSEICENDNKNDNKNDLEVSIQHKPIKKRNNDILTPLLEESPHPLSSYSSIYQTDSETDRKQTETGNENDTRTSHRQYSYTIIAIMLLLVLCFHSIFEGLALGATVDFNTAVIVVFALCAHKGFESLALGLALIKSCFSSNTIYILCFLFSLGTPIGISIGLIISLETGSSLLSAVCLSIGAGTFLYVGTLEIIREEFIESEQSSGDLPMVQSCSKKSGSESNLEKNKSNIWIKYVCLVFSFAVMAVLAKYV